MSRILFDLSATQPIGNTKFHGGGIYGIILFKKIVSIDRESISVFYDDRKYIDKECIELIKNHNIPTYYSKDIDIYDAVRKEGGIMYAPLFNTTYQELPPSDITLLVTVHGLRALEMPNDPYSKYLTLNKSLGFAKSIKNICKRIISGDYILKRRQEFFKHKNIHYITVSDHSKFAMMSFFPNLVSNDIKVSYSPSTINDNISINDECKKFGKYYLIVSANRWIKNGIRAMQAFDELFSSNKKVDGKVVVTGISSWKQLSYNIKNKERFILLGYVDESTLKGLYHHAFFLCYPSLNEGFGYPPLEAMHEKCPVIASAIASIPEICGDAALYFNPYSINEIKSRILQMHDNAYHDLYMQKGFQREKEIRKRQHADLEWLANYLLSFSEKSKES